MKKIIKKGISIAVSIMMLITMSPMSKQVLIVKGATEQWSWPVPATSSHSTYAGHSGRDISIGGDNIEILASRSGTVIYSEPTVCTHFNSGAGHNCVDGNPYGTGTYGNFIKLKHVDDNGTVWYSLYAHLAYNTIRFKVGDTVKQGDLLGYMGSSGSSTGQHLHFEIRNSSNQTLEPLDYVTPGKVLVDNTSSWYSGLTPVDLGDSFDALILNKAYWKPIRADSNNNVVLHKEEWTSNEMWRFKRLSDGSYYIVNFNNLLSIDANNYGTEPETNIGTVKYSGNTAQKWFIYELNGGYVFRPSYTDLVMDLSGNVNADGTNIWLHTYVNENPAQIFSIYNNGIQEYAKPAPEKPTIAVESDSSVKVSWKRTEYTDKYIVYRWFGNDGWQVIGETTDNYYLDKGLKPETEYFYKYESVSNFYKQESDFSSEVTKAHSFGDWSIQNAPTCISEGTKIKTCKTCGYSVVETIEKTSHNYVDTVVEPTCTEEGYTLHECSVCKSSYKFDETVTIPHNYESATLNGKTVYVCVDCGNKFETPFKGSGTQEDPYQISSKEELIIMRDLVNTEGTGMNNKHYIQTADIDLENESFEPIGICPGSSFSVGELHKSGFSGVYNGQGHMISNLKVETESSRESLGLFTILYGESIIENLVVHGEIKTTGNEFVGGICGKIIDGGVCIRNCAFIGNLEATAVGGIAGSVMDQCSIINCYHTGEINSNVAGGIVGFVAFGNLKFTSTAALDISIQNCYHSGKISGEGEVHGGIVGRLVLFGHSNEFLVKNCYFNKEDVSLGISNSNQTYDIAPLSSDTLKRIAGDLGSPFIDNTNPELNNGYPVFNWQLETSEVVSGDINEDGKLTAVDVLIFRQWMLGMETEIEDFSVMDMNDDGIVNIVDFCMLKEAVVSL